MLLFVFLAIMDLVNGLKCHFGAADKMTAVRDCGTGKHCSTLTNVGVTNITTYSCSLNSGPVGCTDTFLGIKCNCDTDLCNILQGPGPECYNWQLSNEEKPLGKTFKTSCSGNTKNCAFIKAKNSIPGKVSVCGNDKEMTDGECIDENGGQICYCNGDLCNAPPDKEDNGAGLVQPHMAFIVIGTLMLFKFH